MLRHTMVQHKRHDHLIKMQKSVTNLLCFMSKEITVPANFKQASTAAESGCISDITLKFGIVSITFGATDDAPNVFATLVKTFSTIFPALIDLFRHSDPIVSIARIGTSSQPVT